MFSFAHSVLLLSYAVLIIRSSVGHDMFPDDCMSYNEVCNSSQKAKHCMSVDWCTKYGIVCSAKQLILHAQPGTMNESLVNLNMLCGNTFHPFIRSYEMPEFTDVGFEVRAGRDPFTVTFNFEGNPRSLTTKHNVKIKLDDRLVYDDADTIELVTLKSENITKNINSTQKIAHKRKMKKQKH